MITGSHCHGWLGAAWKPVIALHRNGEHLLLRFRLTLLPGFKQSVRKRERCSSPRAADNGEARICENRSGEGLLLLFRSLELIFLQDRYSREGVK